MNAGNLEIADLSFKHRGLRDSIFNNLTGIFPRWQITAISGKTGSGKSTLLQIIFGVLDGWSGSIRFNMVNLPSRRFTVSPELFAFVPQKVELLTSTLRGNLLYGVRRDVPDKDLIHLLDFFGLSPFLSRFSEGLDARLEAGSNAVSLGEAQRIALIRAVVSRPKLLLLDEATAHVDNQTEDLILSNLRQLLPESTVVMVTHRLGVLSRVDHHLVLEEGRLRAG